MQLCALKLHVLVHSCGATSKSYTLQTRLVHLYATYALMLHVQVYPSLLTQDGELPPQGSYGPKE